ncbi:hypothetical protein H4R34_003338 [Dimargaris verticillata]|uniref:Rab-GAP TBC domain-containing protein n=1 Tax=Dimargaris verticillata TaxID=2761393 RepID=A0A9W8B728_9FUNG|nr:hypothetical protein H4R34_003338 [Dimargaris verticillata]
MDIKLYTPRGASPLRPSASANNIAALSPQCKNDLTKIHISPRRRLMVQAPSTHSSPPLKPQPRTTASAGPSPRTRPAQVRSPLSPPSTGAATVPALNGLGPLPPMARFPLSPPPLQRRPTAPLPAHASGSPRISPYDTLTPAMLAALSQSPPLRPTTTSLVASPLLGPKKPGSRYQAPVRKSLCGPLGAETFLLAQLEKQNAMFSLDPKAIKNRTGQAAIPLTGLPKTPNYEDNSSQFWLELDQQSQNPLPDDPRFFDIAQPDTEPIGRTPRSSVVFTKDTSCFVNKLATCSETEFWSTVIHNYHMVSREAYAVLTSRVQRGIPSRLRGTTWQVMSRSTSTYLQKLYSQLVLDNSPYEKLIVRDLPRTFPHIPVFRNEGGEGQKRLFNVLKAYSLYDSEVGYCQGLGFILGPLILNMPECEAFCVLVRLMETYDMRTMFTEDMSGLHLRLFQFTELLKQIAPDLYDHFQTQGIEVTMYASSWFLSLFAYTFPLNLVFRIMDLAFVHGAPETIMRVGIALLCRHRAKLLACHDFELVMGQITDRLYQEMEDTPDDVITEAVQLQDLVTTDRLIELAKEYELTRDRTQRHSQSSTTSGSTVNVASPTQLAPSLVDCTPSPPPKERIAWVSPWAKVVNAFSGSPSPTSASKTMANRPKSRGSFSTGTGMTTRTRTDSCSNNSHSHNTLTPKPAKRERSWTASLLHGRSREHDHPSQVTDTALDPSRAGGADHQRSLYSRQGHPQGGPPDALSTLGLHGTAQHRSPPHQPICHQDVMDDVAAASKALVPIIHVPPLDLNADVLPASSTPTGIMGHALPPTLTHLNDTASLYSTDSSDHTVVSASSSTTSSSSATHISPRMYIRPEGSTEKAHAVIEALQSTVQSKAQTIQQLQKEHSYLVSELALTRVERSTLLEENDHLKETIRQLEAKLHTSQQTVRDHTHTICTYEIQLDDCRQQLSQEQIRREHLTLQLGNLSRETEAVAMSRTLNQTAPAPVAARGTASAATDASVLPTPPSSNASATPPKRGFAGFFQSLWTAENTPSPQDHQPAAAGSTTTSAAQ